MNLKSLKKRLKSAYKAFLNPVSSAPTIIYAKPTELSVVLDNQLLAGKNALITGAARNIGRSIAIEMAKQGANIFFIDINETEGKELEKELKSYSVESKFFLCNINKTEEIDALYQALEQEGILIHLLVNNIGICSLENLSKTLNVAEMQQTFQTNIFGPLYLTQYIKNKMIAHQTQGSILFLTSIHQWEISRCMSYSSSKAALGMIIQELALELAPHRIRVNGIAPGWVKLDVNGNPLYSKHTPLYHCSIDPCYMGRAAVYLTSDYFSACTTGTVLKIDGGLSLYNHTVEIMS